MNRNHFLIFGLLIAALGACGGGEGYISIGLEEAGIPAELAAQNPLLEITEFRATVTADDLPEPLVATAGPEAAEIRIEAVPYGDNRTILVEAVNARGDVLRRRRIEGLEIRKGVVSNVRGRMNTVPVALNMRRGSIIPSSRFKVLGFGELGSRIRVSSASASAGPISFDMSPGDLPVADVSPATGLFDFSVPPLALGKQTVTLIDESTAESSSVEVIVVAGELPGRRVVPSGALGPTIGIDPILGGERTRHFPKVLEAMTGVFTNQKQSMTTLYQRKPFVSAGTSRP